MIIAVLYFSELQIKMEGREIFRSITQVDYRRLSLFIRRIGPEDGNGPRSLQRGRSCGAVSYFKSGRTILKVRQLRSRQRERTRTETIFHTPSVGTAPSSRQSAIGTTLPVLSSSYFPFPQSAFYSVAVASFPRARV